MRKLVRIRDDVDFTNAVSMASDRDDRERLAVEIRDDSRLAVDVSDAPLQICRHNVLLCAGDASGDLLCTKSHWALRGLCRRHRNIVQRPRKEFESGLPDRLRLLPAETLQ